MTFSGIQLPDSFKSRKLTAFIVVWITGTVFFGFHSMTAAEWVDFTKWAFGLYAAGNVGEHFASGKP